MTGKYQTREEALSVAAKCVGLSLEELKKLGPKGYPECYIPERGIHFKEIYIIKQSSPFGHPEMCVGLAETKDGLECWILYPDIGLALSAPYKEAVNPQNT